MAQSPTLFISGAGGKLGRRVVELLHEQNYPGTIIAGTRNPEKLTGLDGVEVRKADLSDLAGFTAALQGVDRLLLISTDVLDENRIVLHTNGVRAAVAAGVKGIVYTSMPNPEPPSPVTFAGDHYGTEQAVIASGLPYTILRMAWYSENLLQSLPQVLASGQWYSAAGAGRVPHVTREDCARAAAGALVAPISNEILTVTGPAALTTGEIAAIASDVTGKPIQVVDLPLDQFEAGLRHAGLPEFVVKLVGSFDENTRQGRIGTATDAVEKLSGRKPQDLKSFLSANRAALA